MIDHIFVLIDPDGPEIRCLSELGLRETYRRVHTGQGTSNVCYCFDNMFLELLWVDDPGAVLSPAIRRTGIHERSLWRSSDACPFGIAWRASPSGPEPVISTWAFSPPYLPRGVTIAVAEDGDDPRLPMMFRSPGSAQPLDWPPEKRGRLQHDRGLGAVRTIALTKPTSAPASKALDTIVAECLPQIALQQGADWHLEMRVEGLGQGPDLTIAFPM